MKRAEKIYVEESKDFEAGKLAEKLMKRAAWEAWMELNARIRQVGFAMNESIMEYEFEKWWNEEIG